jgi:hypothetical protein
MSTNTNSGKTEVKQIPEEFEKVINDFINDLKTTFPEYKIFIDKWWKEDSFFDYIEEAQKRNDAIKKNKENKLKFIFNYCLKKYPPRFFDILYQNKDIFDEDSTTDTEFLPQIHFKNLWQFEISEKTKETIWKYLQLILFSIINCVDNSAAFGDTAKLFEDLDNNDFKTKLEESLNEIQKIFEKREEEKKDGDDSGASGPSGPTGPSSMPNAENIQSHIYGILDGNLGKIAKEIAEETVSDLNLDMEDMTSQKDVFEKLFKNPAKLMNIVKNIGDKLDTKIKSGDVKESELLSEATQMMNKLKDIPGMPNIQEVLSKLGMGGMGAMGGMGGMGGKGAKVNVNAMKEKLERIVATEKAKERIKENLRKKQEKKEAEMNAQNTNLENNKFKDMSEEQILEFINSSSSENKKNKKKKQK